MMIVGAGLAGLIAAHVFPRAELVETAGGPMQAHKALLRFRSDSVSKVTGIPFRAVTVRKGIWDDGWQQPNITNANSYALKVVGALSDRSIWDIGSATRYIAPSNFYDQLIESVGRRIHWGVSFDFEGRGKGSSPVISTAPMPLAIGTQGAGLGAEFFRAPVTVKRYVIQGADIFQTIYYPNHNTNLYRASITGDLLVCEFVGAPPAGTDWMMDIWIPFSIKPHMIEELDAAKQEFGKIEPLEKNLRRTLVKWLTDEKHIYSLGRFATWRNILLDDVVDDCFVIKQLLTRSAYERAVHYKE